MDYRKHIVDWLFTKTGLDQDQLNAWLETPPQPELGDFALPCFRLAKHLRRSPVQIAQDLAGQAAASITLMQEVQAVNGYLNFFVDRSHFIAQAIQATLAAGEQLGRQELGQDKTVIVEYSSPNIAKPFHVGHAFTTILGQALYRLYERIGYKVVRVNHLGDYGTQFGKLIVAYRLWGDAAAIEVDPIKELLRIYVLFHEEAKKDPELDDQARQAFRQLEQGAPAEKELWQKFRDLSLASFAAVYEQLGVAFDSYRGESFYSEMIPQVIELLQKKQLLVESEGAQVVMLDEYKLPPCIILKSDGTTIYASRDLAAVLYRKEKYDFAKNIYVVGSDQNLHFRQVFAVLEKAGITAAADCVHVGFGLVRFPDRKLSTRSGDVVLLEDLLQESIEKSQVIITENLKARDQVMPSEEISQVAERIGIGSVVYTFLKNGREKDIIFSWEEMLDFEGDSAPYVQYTYARARSILRRAAAEDLLQESYPEQVLKTLGSDDELALARLLDGFDQAVLRSAQLYEPYILVRHITTLARAFNKYYNHEPILRTADKNLRLARLALLEAVCQAIKTGLDLVGITAVERM